MYKKADNFLTTYYEGITRRLQIEIDFLNRLITHKGEFGRANESLLINLLVKFLPKKYNVGSGIIIDKDGNHSRQIDIIIYDSTFHPEIFSQGAAASLYPVDSVYMAIEVKTTITKNSMEEAIENIESVKKLQYIESPINEFIESPAEERVISINMGRTSPPLGVIFGFDCDTSSFETFESWIDTYIHRNQIQPSNLFDLCYLLRYTFSYSFLDVDKKDEPTKVIYPLEKSVLIQNGNLQNIENFKEHQDDIRNPLVTFDNKERIVDQGVGFLNFLSNIYDLLMLKPIIRKSILREYVDGHMFYESKS